MRWLGLVSLALAVTLIPTAVHAQGVLCPSGFVARYGGMAWQPLPSTGTPVNRVDLNMNGVVCWQAQGLGFVVTDDQPVPVESTTPFSVQRQYIVAPNTLTAVRDQSCPGDTAGYRNEAGRCLDINEFNASRAVRGPAGGVPGDPTR